MFRLNVFMIILAVSGLVSCHTKERLNIDGKQSIRNILFQDDFSDWQDNWLTESENGHEIVFDKKTSSLDIVAPKGFTLWYKYPVIGEFKISLEALVVSEGGEFDRVSDLNFFWNATDTENTDNIFVRKDFRSGVFGRYYSLNLYYIGIGGNSNTTTRFRKYDGDYHGFVNEGKRPAVITEFTDSAHLIKPNHWYKIEILVKKDNTQFYLDYEKLVDYTDISFYNRGWFGIRTTENHMRIRNFVITR